MKVEETLDTLDWVNAMHEELRNFKRNQVRTLVDKPNDKHNVIGSKWVFCNNQDEDGQAQCHKDFELLQHRVKEAHKPQVLAFINSLS